MTVKVSKPAINVREELADLKKPTGIAGEAMLRAETPQEQFQLIGAGRRNLIINGAMNVSQRGTSAVTIPYNDETYVVDRFCHYESGSGGFTAQQVADAPAGFVNSLKITVTTADTSVASGEYYWTQQQIEGYQTIPLAWGTSDAKPLTISFWVKSSVTGTFGAALSNGAFNYGYPFTYDINSANTWEYKTLTVAGPTAGTWPTNNTRSLRIYFDHGSVDTYASAYNGQWVSAGRNNATGGVNLINTLNATWQITGVQLEVGNVATPFEHARSYGEELALCQRYCCKFEATDNYDFMFLGYVENGSHFRGFVNYPVEMRADPAFSASGSWRLALGSQSDQDVTFSTTAINTTRLTSYLNFTGSSLTEGHGGVILGYAGAKVIFDAEL
jgi:hypothetical protein